MFCDFSSPTLADFSKLGRLLSVPGGTILMHEGGRGDQVYVICTGQVKLSCTSRDGRTMNLKIAQPGEVLGLGAVIAGGDFEVTGEALVPTRVKVIRRDDFLLFLHRHGDASWSAAQSLADEYKSAMGGARSMALSSVSGRIARVLLELGRSATQGMTEMRFNMALTHDDIAEFASTSRETVSRTLTKFRNDDLIQIKGATVHIRHPHKLEALAS